MEAANRLREAKNFGLAMPLFGIYSVHRTAMPLEVYVRGESNEEQLDEIVPAVEGRRHGDRNESQTVLRACQVLKAFQHLDEELALTEMMNRTGLPKTTTFRLLRTLIYGGTIERAAAGVYRDSFGPKTERSFRLGFASQGDTEFAREVTRGVEAVAAREHVQLTTLNNRYSAREALRNADLLIREQVDLVLEFQTYERVASVIASKFLAANTPLIAIEVPHPGTTFFADRCSTRFRL